MFMAPGSVLQPAVHLRTLWLNEGGLINYWLEEIEWRALLIAMFEDTGEFYDEGPQKLSLMHLQATFYVYASFLLFSVGVFLCEWIMVNLRCGHQVLPKRKGGVQRFFNQ